MRPFVLLILAAVAAFIANATADRLRPSFPSEVMTPQARLMLPLLKAVCAEGIRATDYKGHPAFGCGAYLHDILASPPPARIDWWPHTAWTAEGLLPGHFLSPTSDDMVVSGHGAETHPSRYGGTLLLTRTQGVWKPVWYRSGLITFHCHRINLTTGRQVLLCEDTDGGMGHFFHNVYVVDLASPTVDEGGMGLLHADSYGSYLLGGVQTQFIDRVSLEKTASGAPLIRVYARHGFVPLDLSDPSDAPLPQPKLTPYRIDFQLSGETLRVTPPSRAAAKLFGHEDK